MHVPSVSSKHSPLVMLKIPLAVRVLRLAWLSESLRSTRVDAEHILLAPARVCSTTFSASSASASACAHCTSAPLPGRALVLLGVVGAAFPIWLCQILLERSRRLVLSEVCATRTAVRPVCFGRILPGDAVVKPTLISRCAMTNNDVDRRCSLFAPLIMSTMSSNNQVCF